MEATRRRAEWRIKLREERREKKRDQRPTEGIPHPVFCMAGFFLKKFKLIFSLFLFYEKTYFILGKKN